MDAYALIAAEEIFFSAQLHRLAMKSIIRVDFNLRSGDELKFLGLTDNIRNECRAIDNDVIGLPDLRLVLYCHCFALDLFRIIVIAPYTALPSIAMTDIHCGVFILSGLDIIADWSTPGEIFSGSVSVDSQELSMLLLEINSECSPFTRYEVAKRLKELCQYDYNRCALADLLKDQFVRGLLSMLQDDNEYIVRFAIYTILNFADDMSTLNNLELPGLPETLRDILMNAQRESTKKLAGDLYIP
ncbi:hypothetical protein PsorP6_018366 [Peronosclerospora sorghi]|nr:hypothetical protein PsorP6_018366 [Peronosclerospora sorghi]